MKHQHPTHGEPHYTYVEGCTSCASCLRVAAELRGDYGGAG